MIIENIELWDNKLLLKFSDSIVKITGNIIDKIHYCHKKNDNKSDEDTLVKNNFYNNLINIFIKYLIGIIENDESEISKYYLEGFNDIIEILSQYKQIFVEPDIIERVCIMGSFGKKSTLRKYSLYFCSSLIRVNFINNLFFIILNSSKSRSDKMKHFKDNFFNINNIVKRSKLALMRIYTNV